MSDDSESIGTPGGSPDGSLSPDVSCLLPRTLQSSLVSVDGSHCDVWRGNRRNDDGEVEEFVLKFARQLPSPGELASLSRDHVRLRTALEDIVPRSLFFLATIDDVPGLCVIAEAVDTWFNIANPQNREEAVAMVKSSPRAYNQLQRFVAAAEQWRADDDSRLIDLFGINNLVMDTNRELRYVDSFYVFFFEDMLHILPDIDPALEEKIAISLERLEYLSGVLREVEGAGATNTPD